MKRIILSVFAAAVTAAWAVPAHAVDITFSGQYRLRAEFRGDGDFTKDTPDDKDSWGQRVRLTSNVKATDDTSVKITLQDTRVWGSEGNAFTPTGAAQGGPALTTTGGQANALDLHEAYLNVDNVLGAPVTLRAGRQELSYGDERLIGSFNWSNTGRAFDALKLVYTSEAFNVDAFWSKITEANAIATDAASTAALKDNDFYGLYATVKAIPSNTLDVYVLHLTGPMTSTASTPQSKLTTIGARLKGSVVGLDYTLELPFQTGTHNDVGALTNASTNAWALAAKVNYAIPGAPANIKVGAEYDYASGTSATEATNGKNKTFFNLFPTNHDKLGLMDLVAWRNISAFNINASAEPMDKVRLYAAFWNFSLVQNGGSAVTAASSWFTAGQWDGGGTTAHIGNNSKNLGNEIDLVANYKYNNALSAEIGYGIFLPGSFIKTNVTTNSNGTSNGFSSTNQQWSYLMLTANF